MNRKNENNAISESALNDSKSLHVIGTGKSSETQPELTLTIIEILELCDKRVNFQYNYPKYTRTSVEFNETFITNNKI